MSGVFVVGALHWDTLVRAPHLPGPDETVTGTGVTQAFGGKGGNQAVAAALHGAAVTMAGRVGADAAAGHLLDFLDRAGVDRTQVQRGTGASGMSVAIVDAQGSYGAVIVSAANLEIDAGAVKVPEECRVVLLQNEIPEAVNVLVARAGRKAGCRVVLNAAPARPMLPDLTGMVDMLIVNRVEASTLTGADVTDTDAAGRAARRLSRGGRSVVVTLGADGVVLCERGEVRHAPALQVDVVSTHGAGDAFVGALAARLAGGATLKVAADHAQTAAALHVSTRPEGRLSVTATAVERMRTDRDPDGG